MSRSSTNIKCSSRCSQFPSLSSSTITKVINKVSKFSRYQCEYNTLAVSSMIYQKHEKVLCGLNENVLKTNFELIPWISVKLIEFHETHQIPQFSRISRSRGNLHPYHDGEAWCDRCGLSPSIIGQ